MDTPQVIRRDASQAGGRRAFLLTLAAALAAPRLPAAPARKPLPPDYAIVTTCGMVTDIVREVAGGRARVTGLMGEGVDPHLYKPTRDNVSKLLKADVIFYSGLLLEGRMTDTFVTLARRGIPVFAVTELLPQSFLLELDGPKRHPDPHVWMDVSAWSEAVQVVARSLASLDAANADHYAANAARYRERLAKLHEYAKTAIASIPARHRVLVTAHDAFGYFGRAYGVEVRGIQGLSTESEAGVADINRLVDFLVERRIPAIFVESSVSDKNIRALIEGCRSRGHAVAIGGTLFSDAMGPAGTYEGTYVGMLDHNITTITRALGGTAPERGWEGKLSKAPH